MDKDIKKLSKFLKLRGREDLTNLFKNSTSSIRDSGQFGSYSNSTLCEFAIYLPIEDYLKTKDLVRSDKELILELLKEIYPAEENAPELTNVLFRVNDDEPDDTKNEVLENEVKSSFIDKSLRVFLCYSSEDGVLAGKIKNILETYYGLEVFLAHEDIEGGDEWEGVIAENLKSTDIFIPLLSENFIKSKFTNQETGMAFILEKKIIPISIDKVTAPYGFIRKIQALKLNIQLDGYGEWIEFGHKVLEAIGKESRFESSAKSSVIRAFKNSNQFSFTRKMVHIMREQMPFNKSQINQIINAYINNYDIREEAYQVPDFIRAILKSNFSDVDKELVEQLPTKLIPQAELDKDDIPF